MTEDTLLPFDLPAVQRKKVTADFEGGSISSDGGLVLLRGAERRLGLSETLAGCIREWRDPERVVHVLPGMLRFRMFAIACGYEDADDCDALRGDPLFKLAVGRAPESGRDLCSQPTMSRLENAPSRIEVARMTAALVDIFCRSFPAPPTAITLDIDDTCDPVHGHQQLSLFNAHYDTRCFLPVHVYRGSRSHFRNMIAAERPRPVAEAYLRLKTLPGEQAQVDWAHFGKVRIGRAQRRLMGFVMVLSYSRRTFLRFYLDAGMCNFQRGHIEAFEAWQGVPRELWYDNLKSVVLERRGAAIRFNPRILDFAGHYRFLPKPVAVARGNEKGRVERAIRYIRDSFFAARRWRDLDDLNAQAQAWCDGIAADRPWPEDRSIGVREAFERERGSLIALPGDPFPAHDRVEVKIGKTPYARFDLNDYSVPHTHVRRTLVVVATLEEVRILDGVDVIASHPRSFDKDACIEIPEHIAELVRHKRQARRLRGQDRLVRAAPGSERLLADAAMRGDNIGAIVAALLRLLDAYGAAELEAAIGEALKRGVPHPNAVRQSLTRRREQRDKPPPIPVDLPSDPRVRDITVRDHDLTGYDGLAGEAEEDSEE